MLYLGSAQDTYSPWQRTVEVRFQGVRLMAWPWCLSKVVVRGRTLREERQKGAWRKAIILEVSLEEVDLVCGKGRTDAHTRRVGAL